jgi:hypothetical protein
VEVIMVLGFMFLVVLFIWGMSGGVVRHQAQQIAANEQAIRSHMRDLWGDDLEIHLDWPHNPQAPPQQGLLLDRRRNRLAYLQLVDNEWKYFELDPKNILAVELVIDNETVSRVSRSHQLGGALAGGLLAGGAGAIIGGLSSGQRSAAIPSWISLQFLVEGGVTDFCFWNKQSTNNWTGLGPDQLRAVAGSAKRWAILIEEWLKLTPDGKSGDFVGGNEACSECGHPIAASSKYCSTCGSAVALEQ